MATPTVQSTSVSHSMFTGSSNITIKGGNFIQHTNVGIDRDAREAINKAFKKHVYLDITHDNDDLKHFEISQSTSVSILQNLTHWAHHSMDFPNVTWLHGVPAAEKTAISVSFAEMLAKEDRLAASFFFPRADTRNLKKSFIPSIAYQICFAIPELAQHVLEAAEKDPVIFGKSLETQMRELIIQPVLSSGLAAAGRWIVVIDGLDTFVTPGDDFAKRVSTIMSDLVPQLEGRLRFCISGWQTSGISREFASCTAVKPLEIYSPDYWATCTVYIGFFFLNTRSIAFEKFWITLIYFSVF